MTRLEQQIFDKEQELQGFKDFATSKMEIFEGTYNNIVHILNGYGLTVLGRDNVMVEKMPIGGQYVMRVYLEVDTTSLSDRRKKNLESKLRQYAPMPICPISRNSIHLCYHN